MVNEPASAVKPRFAEERADQIRRRLKAIEGQVRGLHRLIDEDRPCLDVLMQLSAAQEALSQVGKLVTRNYLEKCMTDALQSGSEEEQARAYDDLMAVIYKYRR
ncbi:MAG: metal-sensitive transcriptional regulator [Chloroflexi bacterium]|nr:metal-sensitive transcriptional regulator [Chloroflexota bacterium]